MLLVHFAYAVPDHDMADAQLHGALHAPRLPGDVEIHAQAAPYHGPQGLQPSGHCEKELHAPDPQPRQGLCYANLVFHVESQVGALFAVAHSDVMDSHRSRRDGDLRGEIVLARRPMIGQPWLSRVMLHRITPLPRTRIGYHRSPLARISHHQSLDDMSIVGPDGPASRGQ